MPQKLVVQGLQIFTIVLNTTVLKVIVQKSLVFVQTGTLPKGRSHQRHLRIYRLKWPRRVN